MALKLEGICEKCALRDKCIGSYNEAFSEKFKGTLNVTECDFYKEV